jgi:hypothetical protein
MEIQNRTSEQLPLPFTLAAVGLVMSYIYPGIKPIPATLLGFVSGVLILLMLQSFRPLEAFDLRRYGAGQGQNFNQRSSST